MTIIRPGFSLSIRASGVNNEQVAHVRPHSRRLQQYGSVNEKRQLEQPGKSSFQVVTYIALPNGMPGLLLIAWEDGRPLKTYGVNRIKIYNMKFTFICIISVISCSVCASGDLEIYPGKCFREFSVFPQMYRSFHTHMDFLKYRQIIGYVSTGTG